MFKLSLAAALSLVVGVQEPAQNGPELLQRHCLACHNAALIAQQRLDEAGWTRELDKMIRWGATVPEDRRDALVSYLARMFGTSRPRGNTSRFLAAGAGSDLVRAACLSCHDDRLVGQQRRTREEWDGVVTRMVEWGASLPADRRGDLLDALVVLYGKL
jgi:mono/diheme cytochrome c family protein